MHVCPFMCVLLTAVSPAKTAEPIKMQLGICTPEGQMNHILDGGLDVHTGKNTFELGCMDPCRIF